MKYLSHNRIFGWWIENNRKFLLNNKSKTQIPSIYEFISDEQMPNHNQIIAYLNQGYVLASYRGFSDNVMDAEQPIAGGYSIFTDGKWLWFYSVPYYIQNHGLILPKPFYNDIICNIKDQSNIIINRHNAHDILNEYIQMTASNT